MKFWKKFKFTKSKQTRCWYGQGQFQGGNSVELERRWDVDWQSWWRWTRGGVRGEGGAESDVVDCGECIQKDNLEGDNTASKEIDREHFEKVAENLSNLKCVKTMAEKGTKKFSESCSKKINKTLK